MQSNRSPINYNTFERLDGPCTTIKSQTLSLDIHIMLPDLDDLCIGFLLHNFCGVFVWKCKRTMDCDLITMSTLNIEFKWQYKYLDESIHLMAAQQL